MRLLNTSALALHDFMDDNIPSYAILSHHWEDEEVIFRDLQIGRGPGMAGYSKITGAVLTKLWMVLNTPGSTLTVSAKRVVLSFQRLSVLCTNGTGTRRSAMLI
jgi:hypothetical protein